MDAIVSQPLLALCLTTNLHLAEEDTEGLSEAGAENAGNRELGFQVRAGTPVRQVAEASRSRPATAESPMRIEGMRHPRHDCLIGKAPEARAA